MQGSQQGRRARGCMAVVGDASGWYVRDLMRAATETGIELQCLAFSQLQAAIGTGSIASAESLARSAFGTAIGQQLAGKKLEGEQIDADLDSAQSRLAWTSLSDLDAVLVRTMPLGSLEQVIFRMDCLQVVQDAGIPIVNSPRCLETAIDKWLTLHRLQQCEIPVPPTIACQDREQALAAFDMLGGDVVVKPLFGGEGRGMMRVEHPDMAWRVFSTLQQTRSVSYVQQYQEHLGYDIRVFLLGDEALAIKRHAKPGNWRTNVAQGSSAEPHLLSDSQRELARRSAVAVAGDLAPRSVLGIDLLPCQDGLTRVLEVNAVPGWRALGQALELDVAAKLLRFTRALVG
ncbi:MAG: RimK family alpha-L-glutamate ligase [bacterium]|nr:RimK family alpha-L-glutamate ligase [bacterium]